MPGEVAVGKGKERISALPLEDIAPVKIGRALRQLLAGELGHNFAGAEQQLPLGGTEGRL